MKKILTDRFKHLSSEQQYQCLQALKSIDETPLQNGVLGLAVSVIMNDGHRATVSKFAPAHEEVSVIVSWEYPKSGEATT